MAEGVGPDDGGIIGLQDIIDKHGNALEADLIRSGLRLRHCPSEEFTWRDLLVFVNSSGPHDRLFAAMWPDNAGWDLTNMLMAICADELRWLHWAKTEGAQSRYAEPPEPIKRPGIKKLYANQTRPGARVKPMTLERAKERFDRPDDNRIVKLHRMFRTA